MISRRRFVAAGTAALLLPGCDKLDRDPRFKGLLRSAEKLTMKTQRLIGRDALAREYSEGQL